MKKSFLIVLIIVAGSCSLTRPMYRYKSAFTIQQPTLLRTDGVYLQTKKGVTYYGEPYVWYRFHRFYENGRYYMSKSIDAINDSILKSTDKNGYKFYFRNKGNNITMELYGGGGFWGLGIYYEFAIVDSTSLTFRGDNNWSDKRIYEKYPDIPYYRYEFIPLDLSDMADW